MLGRIPSCVPEGMDLFPLMINTPEPRMSYMVPRIFVLLYGILIIRGWGLGVLKIGRKD